MKNYWLERYMERDCKKPDWKPDRVKTLESLIQETAHFAVDLEKDLVRRPSPFQEGHILDQCIDETYDPQEAKSWVFLHLYTHAIHQANAIGILIEASCSETSWQLWRTLYESHAVCEFLVRFCNESPQVFRDYISNALLRFWIRKQKNYNELCKRSGKETHYDESTIFYAKSLYKRRFGAKIHEYAWAKSLFKNKKPTSPVRFAEILEKLEDDMTIFYRLASAEIHPTLGHRFVLLGTSLPLSPVPSLPGDGPFSYREMTLEHLTADVLRKMTSRVIEFLPLDGSWRARLDCLSKLGENVLDKLK